MTPSLVSHVEVMQSIACRTFLHKKPLLRAGKRFTLDELIFLIVARDAGADPVRLSVLSGRSSTSIRQQFASLPELRDGVDRLTKVRVHRFNSIEEVYEAFGVPCPNSQQELDEDMFERFKRWEEYMWEEMLHDNNS